MTNKDNRITVVILTTVSVFFLHGLTGWSLLTMSSPLLKPIKPKQERPITITLLNLTESPEPPKPHQPEPQPQSKPAIEPVIKKKPVVNRMVKADKPIESKPEPKTKPIVKPKPKPKPVTKKAKSVQPVKPKISEKKPVVTKKAIKKEKVTVADKPKMVKPTKDFHSQLNKQQLLKVQQAKAAADAKAKADAAKAKAVANAKTTNVKLSASGARWKKQPRFNTKAGKARSGEKLTVKFRFGVDKQGNITSVSLVKSSGYPSIDRNLTRQVRKGKFHPFKNSAGVPVSGVLTLPISITVP